MDMCVITVATSIEEGKIKEQSPLADHQMKVTNHLCEDPFTNILQSLKEDVCLPMANLL